MRLATVLRVRLRTLFARPAVEQAERQMDKDIAAA